MKRVYGIKNLTFQSLALGIQYRALDSHAVNAIDVFTTDPQLASDKYTVLTDPKSVSGARTLRWSSTISSASAPRSWP